MKKSTFTSIITREKGRVFMEEINLKDFYQFYKKYILGVIVVCLLFVAIALVYNIFINDDIRFFTFKTFI